MFVWNVKKFYRKTFFVGDGKTNKQKLKLFCYSIIIGLFASLAFISFFSIEPFTPIIKGIKKTFESNLKISSMISSMVVLGLAGMAVGVGFKTGIFNIGVSGQMIVGGMTAGLFAISFGSKIPNGVGQILIILISLIMGSIVAGFSGFLKAYFKIHEVVSTILINWIAFFFMKWMLDPTTSTILNSFSTSSKTISSNYLLRIGNDPLWPILIILLVIGFFLWIVIYKTRYGTMLKMAGLNADASKFAGINTKSVTIYSMALSGAIAGILGAVIYFGIQNRFQVIKADVIPIEGFNGIAISIIAYSNPLVIIPVSLFFAIIQSGIVNTGGIIDTTYISLVLGILMYISAINRLFVYLKLGKFLRILIYGKKQNELYKKYVNNKEEIDFKYYDKYGFIDAKKIKVDLKNHKQDVTHEHSKQWKKIKLDAKKIKVDLKNHKQNITQKHNKQKIKTKIDAKKNKTNLRNHKHNILPKHSKQLKEAKMNAKKIKVDLKNYKQNIIEEHSKQLKEAKIDAKKNKVDLKNQKINIIEEHIKQLKEAKIDAKKNKTNLRNQKQNIIQEHIKQLKELKKEYFSLKNKIFTKRRGV